MLALWYGSCIMDYMMKMKENLTPLQKRQYYYVVHLSLMELSKLKRVQGLTKEQEELLVDCENTMRSLNYRIQRN